MAELPKHRVVVAAVICNDKGEFLLGKRHPKDKSLASFWSIPAGHSEVRSSEASILEKNLIREVKEEMGIRISIVKYLESHSWAAKDYTKITAVFLCKIRSGKPKPLNETSEIGWFSIKELGKMKLPPNVLRVLKLAHKMI